MKLKEASVQTSYQAVCHFSLGSAGGPAEVLMVSWQGCDQRPGRTRPVGPKQTSVLKLYSAAETWRDDLGPFPPFATPASGLIVH